MSDKLLLLLYSTLTGKLQVAAAVLHTAGRFCAHAGIAHSWEGVGWQQQSQLQGSSPKPCWQWVLDSCSDFVQEGTVQQQHKIQTQVGGVFNNCRLRSSSRRPGWAPGQHSCGMQTAPLGLIKLLVSLPDGQGRDKG
jgi:hypothetical protein